MNHYTRPCLLAVGTMACAALALPAAPAADEAFYKGKTITLTVSTGEGGTYSLNARTVARHMPRHIAGRPEVIVQNMPGGGHMLATNYLYNVAPKDGTAIGSVNQSVVSHEVLNGKGVRYESAKFNWLGAVASGNAVVAVWHTAGVKTFADLRNREIIAGATGDGSSAYRYPLVMNRILGTKFKIVKGYKSVPELELAMTRGEVQARAGGYSSYAVNHPDWLRDKKVTFPVQIGARKERALPDVPLWTDFAETEEQRRILKIIAAPISLGRPFLAPPGVPAQRVEMLRSGLAKTLADPQFLADAARQSLAIEPMTAAEVTEIVMDTVGAPAAVVAKAKAAMDPKKP